MSRLRVTSRLTNIINDILRYGRPNHLLANIILGRNLMRLKFRMARRRPIRRQLNIKFMRVIPIILRLLVIVNRRQGRLFRNQLLNRNISRLIKSRRRTVSATFRMYIRRRLSATSRIISQELFTRITSDYRSITTRATRRQDTLTASRTGISFHPLLTMTTRILSRKLRRISIRATTRAAIATRRSMTSTLSFALSRRQIAMFQININRVTSRLTGALHMKATNHRTRLYLTRLTRHRFFRNVNSLLHTFSTHGLTTGLFYTYRLAPVKLTNKDLTTPTTTCRI